MKMDRTLHYMILRSRFDAGRLHPGQTTSSVDPKALDDAASALFACSYVQVCGPMLARVAAGRRASSIESAVRNAGLEHEVITRLKDRAATLSGFVSLH